MAEAKKPHGSGSRMDEIPEPEPLKRGEITESLGVPHWVPGTLVLITIFVFGALIAYHIFGKLRDLIVWLLIAMFASFALEPAVNWLSKRGWRRGVATSVIIFGLIVLGVAALLAMVPLIADQIRQAYAQTPQWLAKTSTYTQRWFGFSVRISDLSQRIKNADQTLESLATHAAGFGAVLISVVFKALTIGLFTFYLVAEGPRFRRTICSVLPPKIQEQVLWTWNVGIEKTGGYLYSRLLLAVVSSVCAFIAFTIIGVPFALPLALWMGFVSQFIPTVGTYIASALPILVALLEHPFDALLVLIYIVVYQQLENYFLAPKVTAKTMKMNPAVAFGSVLGGAMLLGPVGALIAIPAAAIIQSLFSAYLKRHAVVETELTLDRSGKGDDGDGDGGAKAKAKAKAKDPDKSGLLDRMLHRSPPET